MLGEVLCPHGLLAEGSLFFIQVASHVVPDLFGIWEKTPAIVGPGCVMVARKPARSYSTHFRKPGYMKPRVVCTCVHLPGRTNIWGNPRMFGNHSDLAMVQSQWCHFGIAAPAILEPILVVGLGCSLWGNRGFDPWPFGHQKLDLDAWPHRDVTSGLSLAPVSPSRASFGMRR